MRDNRSQALAVIRQQLAELDQLQQRTLSDLNTVAGTERVTQWKTKTAALIAETVGRQEGLAFAAIQPGPSFTNDLLEEFTELVDCYRSSLLALASRLTPLSHLGG
ncbi:MAG: hypothetical protein NNA23_00070 [Nitrospira sp.]|nr:hypothetical protein [Nitrospira sp.]MCP9464855.1 hypothetical protein [Nitrospira sp.]